MNKKSLVIGLLLVLSTIICFNINPVSAQQLNIDSVVPYTSGTDTILNITVTHIAPDASPGVFNPLNFVDTIEIDMDGAWLCLDCCEEKDVFTTVSIYDEVENCAVYLRPLNYISEVKSLYFLLTEEELIKNKEYETIPS